MDGEKQVEIKPGDAVRITRQYMDSLLLEMRHLDAVIPNTEINIFGKTFQTPIMTAALSHLDQICKDSIPALALGACQAEAAAWCGMGSEEELEKAVRTGASVVKIIKPYAERDKIFNKIKFAETCEAFAVGIDIDHQFGKNGQYDSVLGNNMKPVTTQELEEYVRESTLPFIVKGVLSMQDVLKCINAGVKGIVISHHNGIMQYAIPPLAILPEIAEAVSGKMKIFVDCGIASGYDVYKALALGADAVCVGAPLIKALAAGGAVGVKEKIVKMTEELAGVMAKTCVPDLSHMDVSVIRYRNAGNCKNE